MAKWITDIIKQGFGPRVPKQAKEVAKSIRGGVTGKIFNVAEQKMLDRYSRIKK